MKTSRASWWGTGGVTLVFVALILIANPLHDTPMSDDWDYALTVRHLLDTGQFQRSQLMQATALFSTLWGALFATLFDFSFTTLRLATIPLGLGTAIAFYALLGELGFDTSRRLLGTLTLVVSPLFMFLTNSFMTDIPFLFWVVLAMWSAVRGLRQNKLTLALLSAAFASLAFLTRQLGLAFPAAFALLILFYRPRREWPRWWAASLIIPAVTAASFYIWQSLAANPTWGETTIAARGTVAFLLRWQAPLELARRLVITLVTMSFYLLPLWFAALLALPKVWQGFNGMQRWQQIAGIGAAAFIFGSVIYFGLRGEWWAYLNDSVTKAGLRPFLAHFGYLAGDRRPIFFSSPVWGTLTFIGSLLASILAVVLLRVLPRYLRLRPSPESASLAMVYLGTAAIALPTLIFPFFFERYFVQLLPGVIVLVLEASRSLRVAWLPAAVGLLAVSAFSVALLWDYWNWHDVRWAAGEALLAQGVPAIQIDGGNEWSGWHLSKTSFDYISENNVPITTNPWEYVIDPQYMFTFTPLPGYEVAQELPFYSPFRPGGTDRLLILERNATP